MTNHRTFTWRRLATAVGLCLMAAALAAVDAADLPLTAPASRPAEAKEAPKQADAPTHRPPRLSRDEVVRRIGTIGPTLPDWWNEVELTYPDTLDLAGTRTVEGRRPDVNLGAYLWERIIKDPSRWREGVKLFHHVVEVREGDPVRRAQAMGMLANLYFKLQNDWVRAAYWYQASFADRPRVPPILNVNLTECYWRLGSREMAVETLRKSGQDINHPSALVAQLWCRMGDNSEAMKMAEKLITLPGRADEGHLAAGNICRYAGRLDEAIGHYDAVLALTSGTHGLRANQARARANREAVKALKALDLSRVPDGVHQGEAVGYRGPVVVKVTVAGGAIKRVETVSHSEDRAFNAFADAAQRIPVHQDFTGIDATTGASTTSDAVTNATIHALRKAQK